MTSKNAASRRNANSPGFQMTSAQIQRQSAHIRGGKLTSPSFPLFCILHSASSSDVHPAASPTLSQRRHGTWHTKQFQWNFHTTLQSSSCNLSLELLALLCQKHRFKRERNWMDLRGYHVYVSGALTMVGMPHGGTTIPSGMGTTRATRPGQVFMLGHAWGGGGGGGSALARNRRLGPRGQSTRGK
jgi:hypothetical protein